ncbi:KGGVGR-motif variant AAA ATPase [Amycolatopsis aidingensis]|uniref:KGGVGR-motif variant AAA ATPase n=1 Tax=Amycolatopsis aidingensis TaxID=2842453 RepID=UPI001C0CEE1E|nr:AAA family ATPase [Amycolatopsis aidingensis]
MTIRFEDAWTAGKQIAHDISNRGFDVVLVRDVLGRVSLVLDGEVEGTPADLGERLRSATGAFAADTPVMHTSELFDPSAIVDSPDLVIQHDRKEPRGRLAVLERTVVGADWTRASERPAPHRVTMYGFKGGVGRSTATFMLARHLARQGKCVLAVDLDLESPGLGALAQDHDNLPARGIIDHLVEHAVGNADGLELVGRSQLIKGGNNGEAWLAPAAGWNNTDYLAKLNRIYSDLPNMSFASRLEAAVEACERQVAELSRKPDVVLLDSRAGIHDIAAVALTSLADLSFLFAVDSPQTWLGYRSLFEQWGRLHDPRELGSRLKMVSAMTPEDDYVYIEKFRDNAQQCFAETLYEDAAAGEYDVFNYSTEDDTAPHAPLSILFNSDLVALDPTRQRNWHSQELVTAAFRNFVVPAAELIVDG